MPLLDRGNEEFSDSVQRNNWHHKSGRLSRLLTALVDLQDNPGDRAKLHYLHKRMWRWWQKNPDETIKRGARWNDLLKEVRATANAGGVHLVVPGDTDGDTAARAFVMGVRPQLDAFKVFACGDAFMNTTIRDGVPDYQTGFASCINPPKREEVRARSLGLQGTSRGAASPFDSKIDEERQWKSTQFRMIENRVRGDQAGICVTFAKAAGHVLTATRDEGPRVEIVSYDNHVYVLVNRTGDLAGGWRIPNGWINDPAILIVDPWAASMGYECIYEGYRTYPYKGMVDNLLLVARWGPGED